MNEKYINKIERVKIFFKLITLYTLNLTITLYNKY